MKADDPSALLASIRARLDMTQEDFAKAIKVKWRTYQRYESGDTLKVPAAVLMRAQALAKKRG